jgi:hypothetical protein
VITAVNANTHGVLGFWPRATNHLTSNTSRIASTR